MVALEDLASWTPVALHLDPPAIDWADFRGQRFAEPFLDQSVERLIGGGCDLIRTDLDALLQLDAAPSLEPSGIVLHLSRCGSTLIPRLLATMPGVVSITEPAVVNTLLGVDPARLDETIVVQVLRLLVRALGRVRLGDERRGILKLSSWNIRRLDVLRAAFPNVPLVWVQRRPAEVMASLLAGPPGWLTPDPVRAHYLFGIPAAEAATLDRVQYCARVLRSLLEAASSARCLVIDYRDLPEAVWSRVAPHFGIEPDAADIERMGQEARFSAKTAGSVPFSASAAPIPALIEAAASALNPLYQTLARR
jgi:hypothetical protein